MSEGSLFSVDDYSVSFQKFLRDLNKRARVRLLSQFFSNFPLQKFFTDFFDEEFVRDLETMTAEEAKQAAKTALQAKIDEMAHKYPHPVISQIVNAVSAEFQEFFHGCP